MGRRGHFRTPRNPGDLPSAKRRNSPSDPTKTSSVSAKAMLLSAAQSKNAFSLTRAGEPSKVVRFPQFANAFSPTSTHLLKLALSKFVQFSNADAPIWSASFITTTQTGVFANAASPTLCTLSSSTTVKSPQSLNAEFETDASLPLRTA